MAKYSKRSLKNSSLEQASPDLYKVFLLLVFDFLRIWCWLLEYFWNRGQGLEESLGFGPPTLPQVLKPDDCEYELWRSVALLFSWCDIGRVTTCVSCRWCAGDVVWQGFVRMKWDGACEVLGPEQGTLCMLGKGVVAVPLPLPLFLELYLLISFQAYVNQGASIGPILMGSNKRTPNRISNKHAWGLSCWVSCCP